MNTCPHPLQGIVKKQSHPIAQLNICVSEALQLSFTYANKRAMAKKKPDISKRQVTSLFEEGRNIVQIKESIYTL